MADCPKCGKPVRVYQMSPYCRSCGVHLMFASSEGQFEKDSRITEMSMAFFRYNLVKLKSAYVSTNDLKFRIFAAFFPVIALFLPLGSLLINTPVYSSEISFNVIGLVIGPIFTNGLFGQLDGFSAGPVFGNVAAELKALITVYLVMTVCVVVILIAELLSFIGNKKISIIMMIFSLTGCVSAVMTRIAASGLVEACAAVGEAASASFSIMFAACALLFIVPFISAALTLKNPPVYKFREGDELRVAYRKKYKKGKINLLDIPFPIYESEEDKEERRRLISEAYNINEDKEDVTADE